MHCGRQGNELLPLTQDALRAPPYLSEEFVGVRVTREEVYRVLDVTPKTNIRCLRMCLSVVELYVPPSWDLHDLPD